MRFAFWNTKRKQNNRYISSLVKDYQIDILVLAEYEDSISDLLDDLGFFHIMTAGCDRITILSKNTKLDPGPQESHYSIQILNNDIVLCCIHLTSKMHDPNGESRRYEIDRIISDVETVKTTCGLSNVVFLGDMNEDPYEHNLLNAKGFHALPCCKDLDNESRIVLGERFTKYYNPMWNLLGDYCGPPGTYYHYTSSPADSFWHMLDQVIISKGLCERFRMDKLMIVTETSSGPLINSNNRPSESVSDHLPIIFEIGGFNERISF